MTLMIRIPINNASRSSQAGLSRHWQFAQIAGLVKNLFDLVGGNGRVVKINFNNTKTAAGINIFYTRQPQ